MKDLTEQVASSAARLKIAALMSTRPRTLKELSYLTGISVQGVLKHLDRLKGLGILSENRVRGGRLGARKVYSLRAAHVGDYSVGDLMVVKVSSPEPVGVGPDGRLRALQGLAEDAVVQRVRIREQTRRLGRMIDELVKDEAAIAAIIGSMKIPDEEKLVLMTAFTEESLEDAERALREGFGLSDARRSIERELQKLKRVGK